MQPGEVVVPQDTMPSDTKDATAPKEESADAVAARERRETLCGVRGVYPDFLQKYRTPRCALTVLCLVSFTRSFSMTGVMMVVLPTLERRYQLKGYESGMILSSNDVASCLTMLPVAFLATQRNKPLFIGYGIATMGLGNLVVAMVHFLSPSYQLSSAGSDLCPMTDVGSSCTKSGSIRNFRYMLMIGQLISGLGATPINTVTIAYLDENLPKRKSSLYIGACIYCAARFLYATDSVKRTPLVFLPGLMFCTRTSLYLNSKKTVRRGFGRVGSGLLRWPRDGRQHTEGRCWRLLHYVS
ncbi:solute carrier organic anion transporter family member 4A1-like [Dermacentor andersoni]|uniref:solute carrier organic anion transporter family member 4A1-like n=1 Tax=Dermacentor andersoni TaxID=34620 RepID=UPI003B3B7C00